MDRSDDSNPLASALVALRDANSRDGPTREAKPTADVRWFLISRRGDLICRIHPGTRIGVDSQGELHLDGADDPIVLHEGEGGALVLRVESNGHLLQVPDDPDAAEVNLVPGGRARIDLLGNAVCIDTEFGSTALPKQGEVAVALVRLPEPEPPGAIDDGSALKPSAPEPIEESASPDTETAASTRSSSQEESAETAAVDTRKKPPIVVGVGQTSLYSVWLRGAAALVVILAGIYTFHQANRPTHPDSADAGAKPDAGAMAPPEGQPTAAMTPVAETAQTDSLETIAEGTEADANGISAASEPSPPPAGADDMDMVEAPISAPGVAETDVVDAQVPRSDVDETGISAAAAVAGETPPGMLAAAQELQREQAAPAEAVQRPVQQDDLQSYPEPGSSAPNDSRDPLAERPTPTRSDGIAQTPAPDTGSTLPVEPAPAAPDSSEAVATGTAVPDAELSAAAAPPPALPTELEEAAAGPPIPDSYASGEAAAQSTPIAPVDGLDAAPEAAPELRAQPPEPAPQPDARDEDDVEFYPMSALAVVSMDAPTYPRGAPAGAEARIPVVFTVDQTGEVRDLEIQGAPPPYFERAVRRAVSRWRFQPVIQDGRAVSVRARVTVEFRS
jgi:protein TonB